MAAMLGLLDVMVRAEKVCVGKDTENKDIFVDVTGLSGEAIWKLLQKHPDIFTAMMNMQTNPAAAHPDMLADTIAASLREFGDEEATRRARDLPITVQMKILQAMGRVTFPDGLGPFLEDLKSISSSVRDSVEVVIRAQASTSPPLEKPSEPPPTPPSGS